MASLKIQALILFLYSLSLLISPSHSLNCTSQKFNRLYQNCSDLPSLNSYLHWNYDSSNSSLSIAFVAPPTTSNGWIAWALNPTGTGMAGAQALIAFKGSNGSMAVKTYNISSYSSIVPSKLSYDVSESSAEFSGGLMKIFATLALPENYTSVNHLWQVGGSVTDGRPDKHEFAPVNLAAKGTLELVAQTNGTAAGIPPPAPAAGAPPPPTRTNSTAPSQSGKDTGGSSRIGGFKFGSMCLLVLLEFVLLGFR